MRYLFTIVNRPPHRYHSVYCALEGIATTKFGITQEAFVMKMMVKYNFDRRLHMQNHLRSLYSCFEGADIDAVDYRDILCCMTVLRRFKEVRSNPGLLFRDLVLIYANDNGTYVRRHDALRISRMGAIYEEEIMQTTTRLDRYLRAKAGSWGLKPWFCDLNVDLLMEILETNPPVLDAFRTQLWQQIPRSWRMNVLATAEEFGMEKEGREALVVKQRQASRWYAIMLTRRVMTAWKDFQEKLMQRRAQRVVVEGVVCRQVLRKWHVSASAEALIRKRYPIVLQRSRHAILSRFFTRLISCVDNAQRLSALTRGLGKKAKLTNAGLGITREVLRKRSMRLALHTWCETASLMNAWEVASEFWAKRLAQRYFLGFKKIVEDTVRQSNIDREGERKAEEIAKIIKVKRSIFLVTIVCLPRPISMFPAVVVESLSLIHLRNSIPRDRALPRLNSTAEKKRTDAICRQS